jgi:hypothetical protein
MAAGQTSPLSGSGYNPGLEFTLFLEQSSGGRNRMQIQSKNLIWVKTGLAAMVLAGTLIFMGAPSARGDEAACQHRIARADHRLHEAAEHHGWQSRQVVNARQQLHEAREYCWSHAHKWWDEDGHRWHTDRDWDDHDHDRARDHDHDQH